MLRLSVTLALLAAAVDQSAASNLRNEKVALAVDSHGDVSKYRERDDDRDDEPRRMRERDDDDNDGGDRREREDMERSREEMDERRDRAEERDHETDEGSDREDRADRDERYEEERERREDSDEDGEEISSMREMRRAERAAEDDDSLMEKGEHKPHRFYPKHERKHEDVERDHHLEDHDGKWKDEFLERVDEDRYKREEREHGRKGRDEPEPETPEFQEKLKEKFIEAKDLRADQTVDGEKVPESMLAEADAMMDKAANMAARTDTKADMLGKLMNCQEQKCEGEMQRCSHEAGCQSILTCFANSDSAKKAYALCDREIEQTKAVRSMLDCRENHCPRYRYIPEE